MEHIPYQGVGPQSTAVVSGDVHVAILGVASASPYIESGQVVPIAVLGGKRVTTLPDVPEITTYIPDYQDASSWNGFLVPKGTPKEIVDKLNQYFGGLVKGPMRAYFEERGHIVIGDTPEEMQKVREREVAKWRSLLADLDMR